MHQYPLSFPPLSHAEKRNQAGATRLHHIHITHSHVCITYGSLETRYRVHISALHCPQQPWLLFIVCFAGFYVRSQLRKHSLTHRGFFWRQTCLLQMSVCVLAYLMSQQERQCCEKMSNSTVLITAQFLMLQKRLGKLAISVSPTSVLLWTEYVNQSIILLVQR